MFSYKYKIVFILSLVLILSTRFAFAQNIQVSQNNGCIPLVALFSISVPNTIEYNWNFGDGTTSNLPNPGKIYNIPGIFTVSVTLTLANNSTITIVDSNLIQVFPNPNASFSVFVDTIGACDTTQRVLLNPDFLLNGNTYLWDFGDGQSSLLREPQHTFFNSGTYNIVSIVTDSNGCQAIDSQQVNISVRLPVFADFTASDSVICNPNFRIQLQNNTIGGLGNIQYSWFINGNTTPFSQASNPNWVPQNYGTFNITLISRTSQNCFDTVNQLITVSKRELFGPLLASDSIICPGTRVAFSLDDSLLSYRWQIANRNYNGNPVAHTFTQAGVFGVQVVATDLDGCRDTIQYPNVVRVTSDLQAGLIGTPLASCSYPIYYQFSGTTQAASNFGYFVYRLPGNNLISSGFDSIFTFGFPSLGNYKVVFWAGAGGSCYARDSIFVNLTDTLPVVTVNPSPIEGCLPLEVLFQTQTQLPPNVTVLNQVWHFGNGTSSSSIPAIFTYNIQGVYEPFLIINFSNNCTDTIRLPEPIRASTKPNASYGPPFTSGCVPVNVQFTNTSTDTFSFTTFEWLFNGSFRSADRNPRIVFPVPGMFNGQLIVDNYGCRDTFEILNNVEVFPPKAAFQSPNRSGCDTPHVVNFVDESIGAETWFWDFGDPNSGSDNFSTLQNPTHIYTQFGTYDITLIVTNSNGCTDTLTRRRYVVITNPIASFSVNGTSGCYPITVTFNNNSTAGNFIWDFGDGNTSTSNNPTHIYQTPGNYIISLILTDNNRCSDTTFSTENIEVIGPVISFGAADTIGCAPFRVFFADSSNAGNNIVSWLWNFGDNSTLSDTATTPNAQYNYLTRGFYDVSLTVIDTNGCVATFTKLQFIEAVSPIVNFSTTDTIRCLGLPVEFTGSAQSAYPISQYRWDFGDGTNGLARNPTKTYTQTGLYTIKLVGTDSLGCSDSLTRANYVRIIQTSPKIGGAPLSGYCAPMQVEFYDSTDYAFGWRWSFGDGTTSILRNPAKVYTRNGYYSVSIIINSLGGCSDTINRDSMIHILGPIAEYSLTQSGNCAPVFVQFSNLSTAFRTSLWDFGDGNFDTTRNPIATYFQPGSFNPVLLVTDSTGCQDLYDPRPNIIVDSVPIANFLVNADSACTMLAADFTDLSTGDPVRWFWDFGNGQTDTLPNPSLVFGPGSYNIQLIVTNQHNCSDTLNKPEPLRIFNPPIAGFIADPNPGCMPQFVQFTDTSVAPQPLVSWFWNFGDPTAGAANESILQMPTFTYTRNGLYDIAFKVTDNLGCSDSIFRPQYVVIFDSVAPPQPLIELVTVQNTNLALKWQKTNYFRFGAYLVYRRANHPDSTYSLVNTITNIEDTVFIDNSVLVNQFSYCYYVLVRDLCGKASNVDLDFIHCSIKLTATPSTQLYQNGIYINWNAYVGWQPNSYSLFRQAPGEMQYSLVVVLPGSQTSYTDISLCSGNFAYFVEANLLAQNLASTSNIDTASPNYYFPNQPIDFVTATVENDEFVRISWRRTQTRNVFRYGINRLFDNGSTYTTNIVLLPPTDTTWLDTNTEPHSQWYQYEIYEEDSCGNQSPIGNVAKSIHLTSRKIAFEIYLNWNAYIEWPEGVAYYLVERQNPESAIWDSIASTQASVRTYHDVYDNTSFPEYIYRVTAIRNNQTGVFSVSNTTREILPTTIFVPNAFTPNNDGKNDSFQIKGLHLKEFELFIFDRWGQEIFRSQDYSKMWDGTINGQQAMPGTFVWILKVKGFDGRQEQQKGVVHLIR